MKTRKSLENAARASIRKAAEAVSLANEALVEANAAMKKMEDLSDDELAQVAGGGDSIGLSDNWITWTRNPRKE